MRTPLLSALLLTCAALPAAAQTTVIVPSAPPPPPLVVSPGTPPVVLAPGTPPVLAAPTAPLTVPTAPPGVLAPPAGMPGPLAVTGEGERQEIPCRGRDVLIRGSNNNTTLRGGCHSVTVQGDSNQVQAELQPGAPITLSGENDDVAFVLVEPGPDPLVTVSAGTDRAYRVDQVGPGAAPVATSRGVVVPGGGPGSNNVQVTEMPSVRQLKQELGAQETPRGTLVTLHDDVLFDFDKDTIRADAAARLTQLGQLITQLRPSSVSITGYTDGIGSDTYNLGLSLRRAQSVEHWLETEDRVQASFRVDGRGKADPVAPNTTADGRDNPAGRQQNRRVEILLAHG
jgi:outer membrane protein OmpA-like peptidoglycan-associated protein